eukprot:GEMP01045797.1.p1 GENE.GEMP01045797.1~~GEMP01045797.1.p1  ORF type:complete len:497 (+),score=121.17 GEMP01045797.1:137-1627(+)
MPLVCAISGTTPECPVFTKDGYVFEKGTLRAHVDKEGTCPITHRRLDWEDVTEVDMRKQKAIHPRNCQTASIPSMLSLFQGEWEQVLNDSFALRKHSGETREQLSHALYQHDAACRVIERLIRERDQARSQVSLLQQQLAAMQAPVQEVVPPTKEAGMTADLIARMMEVSAALTKQRKQRTLQGLTPHTTLANATAVVSVPLHQTTAPGILCLDLHPADPDTVLTGGVDGNVALFNRKQTAQTAKMAGHTKRVLHVSFHPQKPMCVLSTSMDRTCRVWTLQGTKWRTASTIKLHQADVTDAQVHPCGDLFVTCSLDKSWAYHDMNSGQLIRHVEDQQSGVTCMNFHPDGLIAASGMQNSVIELWDAKEQKSVKQLEGHRGLISSLSFSENGYYLATSSRDKSVKVWDLRKGKCLQTLEFEEPVLKVRFDHSGQYLAAAHGKFCDVYHFESKTNLAKTKTFEEHQDDVTDVLFGPNAQSVYTVSMDRCLKIWEGNSA